MIVIIFFIFYFLNLYKNENRNGFTAEDEYPQVSSIFNIFLFFFFFFFFPFLSLPTNMFDHQNSFIFLQSSHHYHVHHHSFTCFMYFFFPLKKKKRKKRIYERERERKKQETIRTFSKLYLSTIEWHLILTLNYFLYTLRNRFE